MKFSVIFICAYIESKAENNFLEEANAPLLIPPRFIGLNHVNEIRNVLNQRVPIDCIHYFAPGIFDDEVEIELTENEAINAECFQEECEIEIEVEPRFLNQFCGFKFSEVSESIPPPCRKVMGITGKYYTYFNILDLEAVKIAWAKAGYPLVWTTKGQAFCDLKALLKEGKKPLKTEAEKIQTMKKILKSNAEHEAKKSSN